MALVFASGGAAAQDASLMEKGFVRFRYGVSLRSGAQEDLGPGLDYNGMTPNDLALSGAFYPSTYVGGFASVQREAFSLLDSGAKVTGGSLIRASVGPSGRIVLGIFRLEVGAGYQFAQLPTFDDSAAPAFKPAQRHSVLLASRASLALPLGIVAEARGEFPVSIAASDGAGNAVTTSGYAAGGGVSFPVYQASGVDGRLAVDYQYVHDTVNGPDKLVASQTLSRIGAAIQVDFGVPERGPPPPQFGGVAVHVVDADTGAPIPGATASLTNAGGGEPRPLTISQDGHASAEGVSPGHIVASVTAPGYLPAESGADVIAGQTAALEIRAKKEPPKVGGLTVHVTELDGKTAVANAKVKVRDQQKVTDATGAATFDGLSPGAVGVAIAADGYKPGDEAAQVIAGQTADVAVQLAKVKQAVPATISGAVRSVRGQPVEALLEIPELSQKVQADAKGTFSVTVPAGTYRIIISAPGFRAQTKQVTVKEGDQTIFNVDLHPR